MVLALVLAALLVEVSMLACVIVFGGLIGMDLTVCDGCISNRGIGVSILLLEWFRVWCFQAAVDLDLAVGSSYNNGICGGGFGGISDIV